MVQLFPDVSTNAPPPKLGKRYVVVDPERADELLTIHTRTFNIVAREGVRVTRDVPNCGDEALEVLDPRGIVKPGTEVHTGTMLVGRVEPMDGPVTPEERLLRAIFGEAAGNVRDVSYRAPVGSTGVVTRAEWNGPDVDVVVEWRRELEVGDVLDIDGNRVVVAAIRSAGGEIVRDGEVVTGRIGKVAVARDGMRARSIGPYDPETQQPTTVPGERRGQAVSPAELQALAKHAPWMAWETLFTRCDAVRDRTRAYESLVKGESPYVRVGIEEQPRSVMRLQALLGALGIWVDFVDEAQMVGRGWADSYDVASLFEAPASGPLAPPSYEARRLNRAQMSDISDGRKLLSEREPDALALLDSEKIFGPKKDYECRCGKYKRMADRGVVCEACGVEVLPSSVRQSRYACVELARTCEHPLQDDWDIDTLLVPPPPARDEATNDLYAAVIAANDALERTNTDQAQRALQSAIDELVDGNDGSLATAANEVAAALTGRSVDYSGTAHLVADDEVADGYCHLPREVAAELFKPWTYCQLEQLGRVSTIKAAKKMVESTHPDAVEALTIMSEGYPVLLSSGSQLVARQCIVWDKPAVGVDRATAELLDAESVTIHVPLRDEAALQLASLPDGATASEAAPGGWLSDAVRSSDFVHSAFRAAATGAVDSADDAYRDAVVGRPPMPPDDGKLQNWREELNERRSQTAERFIHEADDHESERVWNDHLDRSIDELEISVRTYNALQNARIETVRDLCRLTDHDLMKLKDFGRGSLKEIKELLADFGLSTGMRV